MYKVKLFNGKEVVSLQHAINEWMQMNKDILVHNSNIYKDKNDDAGCVFFVLYTGPDEQAEELKEMAATVTQQQSIDVKEINPQIMEPSS